MKKGLLLLLTVVIGVTFVTAAFAQAPAAAPANPAATDTKEVKAAAPKAEKMRARGEIVSIDTAAKTMVVKDKKGDMTFDIANAKFGKHDTMESLKAGDKVMVGYAEKDGKMTAKYVRKDHHGKRHPDGLNVRGEVVSVDTASKTIVVKKGKKGEMTLDVANAKFGKDQTIESLKTGDKVVVAYDETDGKMVAKYVGKAHHGKKHHKKAAKEAPQAKPAASTAVVPAK